MSKRLVKIAKELNVGTTTIVEHLMGKGFQIENKPTAKVSDEMYDILVQDFQKSIAIKEQADLLTIGQRKKKEEEEAAALLEKEKAAALKELSKKPVIVNTPPPPPVEEVVEVSPPPVEEVKPIEKPVEEVIRAESPEFKVLGKIDLNEYDKKGKKKKKKEDKPAAKAKGETPKETPAVKEKVVQKIGASKEKIGSKEKKKEEPVAKATKTEVEHHETVSPQLKGLKILGKIDTNRLQKPKSKKKTDDKKTTGSDQKKPGDNDDARKKRKRKRKKIVNGGNSSGNSNNNNNRNNRGRHNKKGQKDDVKEVSKKEVEAQIKATMAKMTGGGKNKRQKIRREERVKRREKQETIDQEMQEESKKISVTEFIAVAELANLLEVSPTQVIMTCMNLGVIVSINQRLDAEVIELVVEEFGHEVEFISAEEQIDIEEEEIEDDPKDLEPRAPIVTVMGHVDHGKTSLLDFIREANVVDGEAGGITQHIGAYEVAVGESKKKITFLDTPGHEAFTAMRARGAKVTDIAVIIIAADDNIMPQTKEAISHAQAAGVPIVFAINKVDKDGARPEKIKEQLAGMNLLVEDWGGTFQSQEISAKTGLNIDLLLEKIILEAEMLALTANPNRPAIGAVLEASLDKGRGYVCKILVQTGHLKIGDPVVAGGYAGKVKAMFNERKKRVKEVGPSTPVLVLGLDGAPQAGEKFKVMLTEQEARQLATKRSQINREQQQRATKRLSLEDIGRRLALGSFKELNLIVKGDFDGSVEALSDSLQKLSIESVQVNIVHKAVGQIIESDILLASASDAIIIGFQVRPSAGARKVAEKEGVQIKSYSVIYAAIEEVKMAIEGMLEPTKEEKITATVEVRETFKVRKIGTVAGCYVQEGMISRNSHIRLIRDGIVIFPTKEGVKAELASLKRFKDDVKEVKHGIECGMSIKNYNDIKIGDIIEGYEIIEIKQRL